MYYFSAFLNAERRRFMEYNNSLTNEWWIFQFQRTTGGQIHLKENQEQRKEDEKT